MPRINRANATAATLLVEADGATNEKFKQLRLQAQSVRNSLQENLKTQSDFGQKAAATKTQAFLDKINTTFFPVVKPATPPKSLPATQPSRVFTAGKNLVVATGTAAGIGYLAGLGHLGEAGLKFFDTAKNVTLTATSKLGLDRAANFVFDGARNATAAFGLDRAGRFAFDFARNSTANIDFGGFGGYVSGFARNVTASVCDTFSKMGTGSRSSFFAAASSVTSRLVPMDFVNSLCRTVGNVTRSAIKNPDVTAVATSAMMGAAFNGTFNGTAPVNGTQFLLPQTNFTNSTL